MNEVMALVGLASALAGAGLGGAIKAALARGELRRLADELEAEKSQASDRVEKLRAELDAEKRRATLLQEACLVPQGSTASGRSGADAVVEAVRGFAFVDAAVVASAEGLEKSREGGARSRDLAACAQAVDRAIEALRGERLIVEAANLATDDARHVVVRPLPRRAGLLAASASSAPPNASAIAAAIARARLLSGADLEGAHLASLLRGETSRAGASGPRASQLAGELEAALQRCGASHVAVLRDAESLVSVSLDGPSAEVTAAIARQLVELRARGARRLRAADVVRCDLWFRGGAVATLCPLAQGGQLACLLVHPRRSVDELHVARLVGRLRRLIAESEPAQQRAGAA